MLPEARVNRSRGIFSNSTHIAGSQQQQQSFHLRNTELRRLLELDQSKQLNSRNNPKNGHNNSNNSMLVPVDSQVNRAGTQINNGNNNKVSRRVTLNTILGYPLNGKIPKKERKKLRSDQWTSTLDIQNLRGSCSIINSQGETQSVSPSRVRVSMPVIEEFQQIVQAEKQQQEAKTPGIMKIIQIKQEKELNRLDMKIEQFNRKNPVLSKKLPMFFFPDNNNNKEKRARSYEKKNSQYDGLSESMVMYKQNSSSNSQQIGCQSMIYKSNEEYNQHNVSSSVLHSSSSLRGTDKKTIQTDESGLRMRPPAISIQDSAKLRQPSKHLVKVVKSQSVYESSAEKAEGGQPQQVSNDLPVGVAHPPPMNSNSSSRTNQNTSSNRSTPQLNYYLSMPKILKRQTEVLGDYSQVKKKHDLQRSSAIEAQKSVGQLQSQSIGAASSPLRTQLQPLTSITKGDKSINQDNSSSSSSDNEDSIEGTVTFEQNTNNHSSEDPSASSSPSHLFKLRLRSLSPTNKRNLLEQIDLQRRKTLKQQQNSSFQSPISPKIQSKPSSSPLKQTSNQKKNITQSEEKSLPFLLFPSQFFQKKSTKKSINRGNIQGNQTALNSLNSSNSKKNALNQPPQSTFPSQQLSNLPPTHQKPSSHHQLTSQGYLNQILQKSLSKQADLSAIRAGTPLSREITRNSRKIRQFGEDASQKSITNIDQSNTKIPSSTFNLPEAATNAYIEAAISKKLLKYQFAADEACIGMENALSLDTKAMKEIAASEFDCETLSFYYRKYLQAAISGYAKSKKAKEEILQGDQEDDNDEQNKEEEGQQDKKLNPKELFVLFRVSHELFDRLQMILQSRLKTLHVPQDIEKGILSASKWLKNSVVASNVLEELGSGSIVSQLVTQVAKEIQINTNIQLLSFLDNNSSDFQQLSNSIDPQILQSKEKQEALLDSACMFFIELLSDQHAKVNSTLEHFLSKQLNFTQIEFFLLKNYTFHTLLPTIKKHIILAALEKIESLRMKILPSQGDQAILSKPNSFQLLLFQLNSKCGKNLQRLIKKKSKVIKGTVVLKGLEAKKEKEQKKKGIGRGVSFSDFIQQKARSQQAKLNEIAENEEEKSTNYPDGFENSPYFPRKPMIREQPAVTSLHLILNPTMNKQGSIEEVVFSPPSLKYIDEKGEQSTSKRNEEQNKQPGSQIIQISLSQLQNEEGELTQKHSSAGGTASSLSPKRYSRPPKLLQRLASIHGSNYNIQTNTVSFSSPRRIQNESLNLNTSGNSSSKNANPFDMHMFEGSNLQQSASLDPTKPLKPNDSQDLLRLSLNFLLSSPNLLCMARLVETQLKSSEDFIELTRLMMIELKNQEAVALSESMLMNLQVRILKVKILLGLEHVYFGLFSDFHEDIEELLKEEVDLYCEVNCSVEVAIFAKALDMKFLSFVIDLVFTHFDIFNADDVPIAKQFFSIEDAALNIQLISLETVLLSQRKGKEKEGEWFEKQAAIRGFIGLLRDILLPYQKR